MPKKIEDIISSSKKRPQSEYLNELSRATKKKSDGEPALLRTAREERELHIRMHHSEKPKRTGKSLIAIVVIALIAAVLGVSLLFAGATLTITPKSASADLNASLTAENETSGASPTDGTLTYQLVALSKEEDGTYTATQTTTADQKATGDVILYNNYSTASQDLVIKTRLEAASNNEIYYTDNAVTIPGYTEQSGTVVPGQVEVTITAQNSGSDYNSDPTDFSIVGFEGTPKEQGFYGRSKTAISGGSSGPGYVVDPTGYGQAYATLQATLSTDLTKTISQEIPEGYTLFSNAITVVPSTTDVTPTFSPTATVPVVAHATGYAYIFNTANLTTALATSAIANLSSTDIVSIENMQSLTFAPTTALDPLTVATQTQLPFTITGTAEFVWQVDKQALMQQILGISRSQLDQVIAQFPGIDRASVAVQPFWQSRLPKKASQITMIVTDPFAPAK